jgi:hypothetical protein
MNAQEFDWRSPNYEEIYRQRAERLAWLRAHPEALADLKQYYSEHIADFIDDWCLTADPRNHSRGIPIEVPFKLFPKQRELIEFVLARMRAREPGLVEKSRDMGASWVLMAIAAALSLFHRSLVIGVGSSKESKVDGLGDPSSLFWKLKFLIKNLPPEFRGNWDESRDCAHMRVRFPDTGSAVVGEAGNEIGRGGRTGLFIVDESAFLENSERVEMSLASNCDTRIDLSTPCGRGNAFAVKRFSGRVPVLTLSWRDDPRKNYEGSTWYARQCELLDPTTLAQEIDLDYSASVEGVLIPAPWVNAAIGAHTKLGIVPSGERRGSLDVADEGRDRCAFLGRHGILLERLKSWSGKNSDIYSTVVKTFGLCQEWGFPAFDFDADGLGAGVRGDAAAINVTRREAGKPEILVEPFRGSGAVFDPEGSMIEGRLNRDFFANLKAQSWWALRLRFQVTHRAVVEKLPFDPDSIISINPALEELNNLVSELSQPTYSLNAAGKILVDKAPDGAPSPNLADGVMISYSPFRTGAFFAAPASKAGTSIKVHELPPTLMDHVFCVITFANSSAAAVFCASCSNNDGTRGATFHVLDWDLTELGPNLEGWVRATVRRLDDLFAIVAGFATTGLPLGTKGMYIDDPTQIYTEFLRQRGIEAVSLDQDLFPSEALPPVEERFAKARPYVNLGQCVIDRPALEREVTFRGSKRNYLREILQAETVENGALAQAFASATLMVFRGEISVAMPSEAEVMEQLQAIGMFGVS